MRARRARLPAAVVALSITSFFTDIGSEMIFPLLPMFVASLGASTIFLGLVEGVADATASCLKLASGYLADHVPRKKPLVLSGYILASVVRPLVAFASAPWHVLAVRVSDRVGKGIRSSPRDVMIAQSVSKEEAGRAFGFHRAFDDAGAVIGPLIATALLSCGVELRTVFLLAAIPGLLSLLAVASVRESPGPEPEQVRISPGADVKLPKSLRAYFAILLLFSLGCSSDAFLLLRAKELGVPLALVPLLWSIFHVSKVVSSYFGGNLADRVPRAKLIALGWGVYALTYLGFGAATAAWQVWALFIVYGSYYGLTEPAEKALVRDLAPSHVRGRAFGYYNFMVGISAIPAGILTGWLWQAVSAQAALASGAAVASVAAIGLLAWNNRQFRAPASAL